MHAPSAPDRTERAGGQDLLFVLEQFRVGGLERVVLAQVSGLLDRGRRITVAVVDPVHDNPLIAELDPRAELVALPGARLARIRALRRLSHERIALLHFGKGQLFASLRPGLTPAHRVVRFCHSDYSHLRKGWKNVADRIVASLDHRIIAVGGRSTEFMLKDVKAPAAKIATLANVIPPTPTRLPGPQAGTAFSRGRGPRIIAVADLSGHKGQSTVLRGLPRILENVPDAELVLVGDGTETFRLRQLAQRLGVLGHVCWLGAVWHAETVQALMKSADVFVSMSRAEGIPISVLEARRLGLPMVLSDIPGHRDGAGEAAHYVPVDEAEAFAASVVERLAVRDKAEPDRHTLEADTAAWSAYLDELEQLVASA